MSRCRATIATLALWCIVPAITDAGMDSCAAGECDMFDDMSALAIRAVPSERNETAELEDAATVGLPYSDWPEEYKAMMQRVFGRWTNAHVDNTWTFQLTQRDRVLATDMNNDRSAPNLQPSEGGSIEGPVFSAAFYNMLRFRFVLRRGADGVETVAKTWRFDGTDAWDGPLVYRRCGAGTGQVCYHKKTDPDLNGTDLTSWTREPRL